MKEDDYLPISDTSREDFKKFYTWTIEDAISAQEEWGKGDHNSHAKGPLFKWIAVHELKEMADKYEDTRDNNLILAAVYQCAMNDLPMPRWCVFKYIKSYRDVYFKAVTSWDDSFGRPHPKGTHANDIRKWKADAFRVKERIEEIVKKEDAPIEPELFERVGKELGMGAHTTTSNLYYYAKHIVKSLIS
jgi:hypothetical protein